MPKSTPRREWEARHASGPRTLAQGLHIELFPEEWDWAYDSSLDSKERRRGINPMASDYTERHAQKRLRLGLPPHNPSVAGADPNTLAWIEEKLESMTEAELRSLVLLPRNK